MTLAQYQSLRSLQDVLHGRHDAVLRFVLAARPGPSLFDPAAALADPRDAKAAAYEEVRHRVLQEPAFALLVEDEGFRAFSMEFQSTGIDEQIDALAIVVDAFVEHAAATLRALPRLDRRQLKSMRGHARALRKLLSTNAGRCDLSPKLTDPSGAPALVQELTRGLDALDKHIDGRLKRRRERGDRTLADRRLVRALTEGLAPFYGVVGSTRVNLMTAGRSTPEQELLDGVSTLCRSAGCALDRTSIARQFDAVQIAARSRG